MIQRDILKKPAPEQTALEMVTLDSLVRKDHLLRKIDAVIDFSFIHDRVAGLCCVDNGRPPLDPTLMLKALFIGYLFRGSLRASVGARDPGECRLSVVLAHEADRPGLRCLTLSQNRRSRFNDTSLAQEIFDAIVEQAIRRGLVDARCSIRIQRI